MTTTCPGRRVGTSAFSTYASKTALLVAPLHRQRRPHARECHAGEQGDVLPPVVRRFAQGTFASARPGVQRTQRSVRRAFIHEHETTRFRPLGDESARQAALKNSSRSDAPTDLFFCSNPCAAKA